MKPKYRNVAFLAELLINVLVFSISCAILAGLFGQAAKMARQTKEESFASAEIYSLFETMRARGPMALTVSEQDDDGTFVCLYDADWRPSVSENPAYSIRLTVDEEETGAGVLRQIEAFAADAEGKEICRMETQTYHPGTGGAKA